MTKKCSTKVWEADPNYLLRECEFINLKDGKRTIDIDVLEPGADVDTDDALAAQMRLKLQFSHVNVAYIEVEPPYRQRRWGTKLYEEARALTCDLGKPLSSDATRSEFSEGFWRKQQAKGRARCIPGEGQYWGKPRADVEAALDDGVISASEYRRMVDNAPEPERSDDGDLVWPCLRYELVGDPCVRQSLEAVRRRRRKPPRRR